jgi:hypothetical protein
LSLSSLLRAGRGPVWDWFEASFPNTQEVSTEANRRLRGGPASRPCDIAPPKGSDCSLAGTAVGYLLTAHLRPDSLRRGSVAASGAMLLNGRVRPDCPATERAAVERLAELLSDREPADQAAWREVCLLCIVLARFEQWFRAGPAVADYTVSPLTAWNERSLVSLGRSMARSDATVRDLIALGPVVLEDHGDMALASRLHLGPTFVQSVPLGGADADLICEGLLMDLKSSAQARIVGRHQLWQLAGYLLADTSNDYNIHSVGFAALRRRRCTYWPAQTFLDELGGSRRSLPEWRSEFDALLRPLRPEHRRDREQRLRMKGTPIGRQEKLAALAKRARRRAGSAIPAPSVDEVGHSRLTSPVHDSPPGEATRPAGSCG